ncbi:MAG: hypothetical protein LBS89_03165, partial [Zoogloeaceae bacterium]|nr:hypothetical protein [Zoogloeaceae bacterium]
MTPTQDPELPEEALARRQFRVARYARHRFCFVAALALLGWTGSWHWFPELFAHFFFQYLLVSVVLTALLFWSRAGHWRWAALLATVLAGWTVLPFWLSAPAYEHEQATRLHVLQFNAAGQSAPLTQWLIAHRQEVDVVLVLEAAPDFEASMAALATEFPYRVAQLQEDPFGIALMSRYPLFDAQVVDLIGANFPVLQADV